MITYDFLQHYWWLLVALLGGLLVFLFFVQGANTLIFRLGRTEEERSLIINSTGRKWEFTFTTLVTFGGAFFASFPLFYSTSFGGAYWVWMLILASFVLQAVAYEYQNKPGNVYGRNAFRRFLVFNGFAGPFLVGAAVATFFTGSAFVVDHSAMDAKSLVPVISRWANGWAVDPATGTVAPEAYKYLHNLLAMPAVLGTFLVGVVLVLYGVLTGIFKKTSRRGIWPAGVGVVLTVLALLLLAGYNNTCYYPSSADIQSSLTIMNSCSTEFTLRTMAYVSLLIPFVLAYIFYAWRALDKKSLTREELKDTDHKY